MGESLDRRLWNVSLGLLALMLSGVLALVAALALGWNSPYPRRAPDWRAPNLPLRLAARPEESTVVLLGDSSGDFALEVGAIPHSGPDFNGYGLVYRAQDADNYRVFAIGSDGYYAVLRVEGPDEVALVEWQQFPHINRGSQANRLRVTCVGPTCRFAINDEHAVTVEDDTLLAGDVGVWVHSFERDTVALDFLALRMWLEE